MPGRGFQGTDVAPTAAALAAMPGLGDAASPPDPSGDRRCSGAILPPPARPAAALDPLGPAAGLEVALSMALGTMFSRK